MSATLADAAPNSTPILDRAAPLPPPAPRSSAIRVIILVEIAVLLLAPTIVRSLDRHVLESVRSWILAHFPVLFDKWTATEIAGVLLTVLLMLPVVVAVHEVGHMLAGLAVGFRFGGLAIGPLQIHRPFHLSFQRVRGTGNIGWARMIPVAKDNLRTRALVFVAGGPAINLLSGGALWAMPYSKGLVSEVFIVVSIAVGVIQLPPFRSRISVSDGRRLYMMLRNRAWGERWLAMIRLVVEASEGVLPESLSQEWIATAMAYRDESPDTVMAHWMAFSSASYKHDDIEAGRCLETALQYAAFAPPVHREGLMSDAAVFQARRRKRADLAEQWLADMPQLPSAPWLRMRVEAAILETRGDIDGASRTLAEVEREIRTWPDPMRRDMTLRLLERWRSEVESQRPSTSIDPAPV